MQPNILLQGTPSTVEVDGVPVPINCDWRTGIRAMQAMDDPHLDQNDKARVIIALYYGRWDKGRFSIPEAARTVAAMESAVRFFALCEPRKPEGAPGSPSASRARLWDWDFDAPRVIADFQREYGIDLTEPKLEMHWWRFWSLFRELSDTSKTMQAIGIRGARPSRNMGENEKKQLLERQRELALPARTEDEALKLTNMIWEIA